MVENNINNNIYNNVIGSKNDSLNIFDKFIENSVNDCYKLSFYNKINKNIINNINNIKNKCNNNNINLNILSRNIRGLSKKVKFIKEYIKKYKIDILLFQEPFIDYQIRTVSQLPNIKGYNKLVNKYGRICIYIRSNIIYETIKINYNFNENDKKNNNYFMVIRISALYIINWYRAPRIKRDINEINSVLKYIYKKENSNNINVIIAGDINNTHDILGYKINYKNGNDYNIYTVEFAIRVPGWANEIIKNPKRDSYFEPPRRTKSQKIQNGTLILNPPGEQQQIFFVLGLLF